MLKNLWTWFCNHDWREAGRYRQCTKCKETDFND